VLVVREVEVVAVHTALAGQSPAFSSAMSTPES
jgi:hypothetical protein